MHTASDIYVSTHMRSSKIIFWVCCCLYATLNQRDWKPQAHDCSVITNIESACMYIKGCHEGPSWPWSHNYICNQCLSQLMLWVWISIRAWCTTLCDKVCQWLATGWWFSPGPPFSSTNKTDCRDITKIVLKVALKTNKQTNKQTNSSYTSAWP